MVYIGDSTYSITSINASPSSTLPPGELISNIIGSWLIESSFWIFKIVLITFSAFISPNNIIVLGSVSSSNISLSFVIFLPPTCLFFSFSSFFIFVFLFFCFNYTSEGLKSSKSSMSSLSSNPSYSSISS